MPMCVYKFVFRRRKDFLHLHFDFVAKNKKMRYNRDIQNIPLGKYALQFDRLKGTAAEKNQVYGHRFGLDGGIYET